MFSHNEVQDLSKVKDDIMLTPCSLCCRAFLNKESACKHVIICHENYNENNQKPKYSTNLKSALDVRVTNLSELLLNQFTKSVVVVRATQILNRELDKQHESKDNISESDNQNPNYHVSEFCKICLASPEDETSPILAEILFEGRAVNFPVKFSTCGDGLELVELAGVTKGYCYKFEILMADPKFERGRKFSGRPILLNGEAHI